MDKLQELTEKLYQQGLSKGKAEGEQILSDAKTQAQSLVEKAQEEAAKIIADAQKKAEDIKAKAESDIKMACSQSINATKKDIENLLVDKITLTKVSDTLSNAEYIKEIISVVAKNFNAQQASEMNLVLPQNLKEELEPWCRSELAKELGKEVKAEFSKKIQGGFSIGPKDGSYFISLSEETFSELIGEYLRPVTRKILFGE